MADIRHFEKWKIAISQQRFDRSPQNLVRLRKLAPLPCRPLKFIDFFKFMDGCHVVVRREIWQDDAFYQSTEKLRMSMLILTANFLDFLTL